MTHFATLNWVITILSLAATLCAGLYVRRYVGSLEDYLVAGRGTRVVRGSRNSPS